MEKIHFMPIGFSKVRLTVFKLGDVVFSHQGVHFFPVKRHLEILNDVDDSSSRKHHFRPKNLEVLMVRANRASSTFFFGFNG
jgi:hypothetical protein